MRQNQTQTRSLATIKRERADAGQKVLEMRSLLTPEKRDFTDSEQVEWETRNKSYNDLDREYQRAKDFAKVQDSIAERDDDGRVGAGDFLPPELRNRSKKGRRAEGERQQQSIAERHADSNLALQAWFKRKVGVDLNERELAACKRLNFKPSQRGLEFNLMGTEEARNLQRPYQLFNRSNARHEAERSLEKRGFNTYDPTAGGVLVNPTFASQLELAMLDFSGVMQVAEVITTGTGAELRWPTGNDTSNSGELLNSATAPTTDTSTPFASKSWFAYKFSSKLIKVDQELIEDNSFNLPAVIAGMLGERLGRSINTYCTTGNGANEPEGIVTGSSMGKTAASATAITAAELIDLQHSVDPAYRGGAAFMMHDSVLAYIRKLQDSQNRFYINFIDGLREGVPDRLLGWPIYINQAMDSTVAATKKTILAGQLSKYKMRRVNAVRMYRLQERYRDTDQDGFVAFLRLDGKLLNAGVNPVKHFLQS
jgi:HK97 family phage major capsid protein